MMLPYKVMPDGVQEVMTTKWVFFCVYRAVLNVNPSYLSPFAFTQTLLPLLIETAKQPGSDVRIVNVCQPVVSNVRKPHCFFSFLPEDTGSSPLGLSSALLRISIVNVKTICGQR